jgi:Na+/H+ antiporter NhaD/arsenite permease-like protein
MSAKLWMAHIGCVLVAVILGAMGQHVLALGWTLVAAMILLSLTDDGKPNTKTLVTTTLGIVAFFIYAARFGIPAAPHGDIVEYLEHIAESVHLEIFIFLAGLYLVVNTFSYSGFIGDLAWKIVKQTQGNLGRILFLIMILTCVLSGIFDGATITTIMGIITLTILLSSGMRSVDIVKILLLLVVATNIGGVWFVLGEPTNILAAAKLNLSPFFFMEYASFFALPAAILCAFAARHIAGRYPRIRSDRPELEILLEGISLRRTHQGTGTLEETLRSIGKVEIRSLAEMMRIVEEEGLPDFEAALKAGIPRDKVHEALAINLNSEVLASELIDYYHYRGEDNPLAELLIGDMLKHVHDEYRARTRSRNLILASGVLLIALLVVHAFVPSFPTWASTIIAGFLAITAVQAGARRYILTQTYHNIADAFFLVAIFATISELKGAGAFDYLGQMLLNMGSPMITGAGILTGSALLSAFADNVAVMDVLTNLITGHPDWSYFALAAIVGTSLGGFASPIASVQAVIMATIIRRVAKLSFGRWVLYMAFYFALLVAVSIGILFTMRTLGLPPATPH